MFAIKAIVETCENIAAEMGSVIKFEERVREVGCTKYEFTLPLPTSNQDSNSLAKRIIPNVELADKSSEIDMLAVGSVTKITITHNANALRGFARLPKRPARSPSKTIHAALIAEIGMPAKTR